MGTLPRRNRRSDASSRPATLSPHDEHRGLRTRRENVPIGEAADPVAVVCRFGDLKAAAPLPVEVTADFDRGTDRKVLLRGAIWKTIHFSLGSAVISACRVAARRLNVHSGDAVLTIACLRLPERVRTGRRGADPVRRRPIQRRREESPTATMRPTVKSRNSDARPLRARKRSRSAARHSPCSRWRRVSVTLALCASRAPNRLARSPYLPD